MNDSCTAIEAIQVSAYAIPTDFPESDGTYAWDRTTLVLAETSAGGQRGLGYTYADVATAQLIHESLAKVVRGRDAMDIPGTWAAMVGAIRNLGRPGICSMAIAAVDASLWDLKGRLLDLPLVKLLGAARDSVPIYGSGGFTSYSLEQLREQLGGWAAQGIPRVKMKIGTQAQDDLARVRAAREAVGPEVELFVDANGAYQRKQALAQAEAFADLGVSWFEEPVSSDDVAGLHLLRNRAPPGMEIAAGEYGYDLRYFRRMLEAEAVDVLQADATRCAGITGFLQVGALCQARSLQLSAHCGPSLHVHPCCSVIPFRHLEYFHDHVRIEHMLFDGSGRIGAAAARARGAQGRVDRRQRIQLPRTDCADHGPRGAPLGAGHPNGHARRPWRRERRLSRETLPQGGRSARFLQDRGPAGRCGAGGRFFVLVVEAKGEAPCFFANRPE